MRARASWIGIGALALVCSLAAAEGAAEERVAIVLPQRHVMHRPQPEPAVAIVGVDAAITVHGRIATTALTVRLRNPAARPQEAVLCLPVPEGAAITGIAYDALGSSPKLELLPRDQARGIYQDIVRTMRDPALVEFAGASLIRSSVFPVPAGATQALRIVYEQALPLVGGRVEYVLPRSERVAGATPWTISAVIHESTGVAGLWSPSHAVVATPAGDGSLAVALAPGAGDEPGSFRLAWMPAAGPATSVVAFPDSRPGATGGWFLLLAGAPPAASPYAPTMRREITVVIDRSGSMTGGKLAQVASAARGLIDGLGPDERFNLIAYHHGVERFAEAPVRRDAATTAAAAAWLDALQPRGGTNIHDALAAALAQPSEAGSLPIVVFLTDGIATVSETRERAIRDMARAANPHRRRIFTLGVGADVNAHLLEALAADSRAAAMFAFPGEDLAQRAGELFDRLRGPVLADLRLEALAADGSPAPGRIIDREPTALSDLFAGQRLLVAGRYLGSEPVLLRLHGRGADGSAVAMEARLDPAAASTAHGYVPRLWATRRIAELIDAVRALGDGGTQPPADDPRQRELVDEIVRLSREFGVLTEYTAFLAREPSPKDDRPGAMAPEAAAKMLLDGGARERSGAAAVAQSENAVRRKDADTVNLGNHYRDATLAMVSPSGLQPQADRCLSQRAGGWVDSRAAAAPTRTVAFASEAWFAIVERLAREHRQGAMALDGDIVLELDGETVLLQGAKG